MIESTKNDGASCSTPTPVTLDGSDHDSVLAKSEFLTRQEVVARRSRRVKQLARIYRRHYWALMEELKIKHREYYWKFGKSPYKEETQRSKYTGEMEECNGLDVNLDSGGSGCVRRCAVAGCRAKAMALTKFCHPHILSDPKQQLYKGCTYVIKSGPSGPIQCGKPILRSVHPAYCPVHFEKAEKHVAKALKKAGLNVSSPSKLAPKFHVIVAEYVRQIQIKRRFAQKETVDSTRIKEEIPG